MQLQLPEEWENLGLTPQQWAAAQGALAARNKARQQHALRLAQIAREADQKAAVADQTLSAELQATANSRTRIRV